jgi:opacity protein-like surface antigen
MKKILVMTSLFIVTTSMMAVDTKYFIGAGGEYTTLSGSTTFTLPNSTITNEGEEYSKIDLKVKAGVILNNAHRISTAYSKKDDSEISFTTILANYDYLIPVPMNNVFRSYVGMHIGRANLKSESLPQVDISGLAYGLQTGIIYDITKHIEFELGVSYTRYNFNESFNGTEQGIDFVGNLNVEDSISGYSGLNYKF